MKNIDLLVRWRPGVKTRVKEEEAKKCQNLNNSGSLGPIIFYWRIGRMQI